ncbi:hypothetical protein BJP36_06720 [Moorena producens JHB]|uniref:Uncharacterized protein n=1 Tax=Moorena producens (strain JHB) TaxID=1454205 RepID=A0A1D9FWL5_MOOP1|nr:hypothetical protein [Moorena producens]AOY79664.1 hypothetical protein BJP36_06720 [Moorena producens JHB]
MLKVGTLVRVLYPEYVAGLWGRIEAQEESGRWIVRLEENPFEQNDQAFLLSLDESDFEVIKPPSF